MLEEGDKVITLLSKWGEAKGYSVVECAEVKGASGIKHKFSLLMSHGSKGLLGIDIVSKASSTDIIRLQIKRIDTGIDCMLLSIDEEVVDDVLKISRRLGLEVRSLKSVIEEVCSQPDRSPQSYNTSSSTISATSYLRK